MAPAPENDALTAALLWLKGEPPDSRLAEVGFGRYSDRTGCWWSLRFVREVLTGEVRDSRQDDEQRVSMVIEAWTAIFTAPPSGEATGSKAKES
jgi:hypothetical protein